jgi:sugar fermentation stimulation protein A
VRFSTPLHKGILIKRYKRFLADVRLADGTVVTVHCPNTGSMESCYNEGCTVWLSPADDPKRKLQWTWEFTETPDGLIGVNTARPNQVVAEAVAAGKIKALANYTTMRREVKYGKNSRIDLLLESAGQKNCYVEIKNTTLRRGEDILFPDAVTERGRKHLEELSGMVEEGHRAVMLFFVNRPDGKHFRPADAIDPAYGKALRDAVKSGVEVIALRADANPDQLSTGDEIPVYLET